MKYEILRTDTADAGIRKIILYIAQNFGKEVALEKLDEIERKILELGENPYLGMEPRYPVLKRQGYKVLILEKDLVFYKVDETGKKVIVYAVVDQRQDYLKKQPPHSRDFSRELGGDFIAFFDNIWYNKYMDKSAYFKMNTGLTYGRGYVYSLQYHIVWCTKYRKRVLTGRAEELLKQHLLRLAFEYGFTIEAMEVMPDHVHLLLNCSPQFELPRMVKILKGNTARWLFMEIPSLKNALWGGHLWNPSYCAVTVSDRSFDQVREYIDSQKERQ